MANLPKELSQIDLDGFVNALAKIGEELNRSRIRDEAINTAVEATRNINLNDPSSVFSEPVIKNLLKLQSMPGKEAAAIAKQLEGLINLYKPQVLSYGQQFVSPTGARIGERMPDKPEKVVPRLESITDEKAKELGIEPSSIERITGPGGAVREIRHYPKVYFDANTGQVIRDPITNKPKVSTEHVQASLPNIPTSGAAAYGPLSEEDIDKLADLVGQNRILPRWITSVRDPDIKKIVLRAVEKYPGFDATKFYQRMDTARDFSTKGKSGQNLIRLNQAVGHLGSMLSSGQALKNAPVEWWNEVANFTLTKFANDPRVRKFRADAKALAGELAAVFKGTSGTDQEIKKWMEEFDAANSPASIDGIVNEAVHLLISRVLAMRDIYTMTFDAPPEESFFTSKAKEILTSLGYDPDKIWEEGIGYKYYNPSQLPIIAKNVLGEEARKKVIQELAKRGIKPEKSDAGKSATGGGAVMELTPEKEMVKDGKIFIKVGDKVFKLDPNFWEKVDGKWRRKQSK